MGAKLNKAIEILVEFSRLVWDGICRRLVRIVKPFKIVGFAALSPRRYCRLFREASVFAASMMQGGVYVDTNSTETNRKASEIHSVVQFDGDIVTKIDRGMLKWSPGRQSGVIERHFHEVESALEPLLNIQTLISVSWAFGLVVAMGYAAVIQAASWLSNYGAPTDLKAFLALWSGRLQPGRIFLFAFAMVLPKILSTVIRSYLKRTLKKYLKQSWAEDTQKKENVEGDNFVPQ